MTPEEGEMGPGDRLQLARQVLCITREARSPAIMTHQAQENRDSGVTSHDVSVKVDDIQVG
jgi:hypothetical protein